MRVCSQDCGQSHVYIFRQNTQAESKITRRLNSRDKLQQLRFTTYVLTTMKSPHLLSTEIDLLTRMISSGAMDDFVKINFALVVPRQVSPIWLTRCLLGSWVGALCCSIESFFACVKVRLQYRRTLCLWPITVTAHTDHLCHHKVLCHVTGISMLRVLRTIRASRMSRTSMHQLGNVMTATTCVLQSAQ